MKKTLQIILAILLLGSFSLKPNSIVLAATVTDSFTDTTKINTGSSSNYSVTGGQLTVSSTVDVGDGADGACTVSANTNINTGTCVGKATADGVNFSSTANTSAGSTTIVLSSTPTGLAVGDDVLIINLQGTSGDNANVGQYETKTITAINTNTLTLNSALTNGYNGTTQKIMVQRVPNYTNVTINSGQTLSASAWDGTKGGIVAFKANGTVTVTGSISTTGMGYRGGSRGSGGIQGESYKGTGSASISANGGGGGGGCHILYAGYYNGGGGGGGGYGATASIGPGINGQSDASAGTSFGTANLSTIFLGTGGGGGGDGCAGSGGSGGTGGGIVFVNASTLSVTGSIVANGNTGNSASGGTSNCGAAGGGGGSGGSIRITSGSSTLGTNLLTATAGSGGSGSLSSAGGAGAVGRIAVGGSITGTTNPTYTSLGASGYQTSATIQSTNLLASLSVGPITSFAYNLSSLPAGSSATIQFSRDDSTWKNAAGTVGATNSLSSGSNSISLSNTLWFGANFYYKIAVTTNGTTVPTFDDITVDYSADTSNAPSLSGDHFIYSSTTLTSYTDSSHSGRTISGVDSGGTNAVNSSTLTLISGALTIAGTETVVAGSIVISDGSSIIINTGGEIKPGSSIWAPDVDNDGYPDTTNTAFYTTGTTVGGAKRRGAMTTLGTVDCAPTNASSGATCGPSTYGDGHDGAVTISAAKNINTDPIATGRTIADSEAFAVSAIGTNTATLTGAGTDGTGGTVSPVFDAASGTWGTGVSSITWSHTVTGSNTILLVGFANSDNGPVPTGVTYNGTAMTLKGDYDASGAFHLHVYYMLNPPTGAHNVVATVNSTDNYLAGVSTSYTGVNQTTPFGTAASSNNNSTSISNNVTSATDELVIDWIHLYAVNPGVGAGQTQRAAQCLGGSSPANRACISTSQEPGAATVTMSWTTNQEAIHYAIPLKPAPAASVSDSIAAGDEVMLINLQGDATNNSNVGKYENFLVQSVSGATVTFTSNVAGTYGVGGNTTLTGQKIVLQRVPNYTNVTINSGQTLTANTWDGIKGGVIAFKASGTVTVNSTGSISASSLGYLGGAKPGTSSVGYQGTSQTGTVSTKTRNSLASGGGGGGINADYATTYGSGGAGGSYGTAGSNGGPEGNIGSAGGSAGTTYGTANLSTLFLGSGGGSGGSRDYDDAGYHKGGNGGGVIFVSAPTFSVSGTIVSNGENGQPGQYYDGGGGGGSGGSIKLVGSSLTLGTSLVTASNGTAGAAANAPYGGVGGAGGAGRIAVSGTVSGTTNPTYTSF